MAVQRPAQELIKLIGHDGGAVIWNVREPYCRRGFHIQECIEACAKLGYSVTPIELFPVIQSPPGHNKPLVLIMGNEPTENWKRFHDYIRANVGVIEDQHKKHAIYFGYGTIIDPDTGECYEYSPNACEDRKFIGTCLWLVRAN